MCLVVVCCVVVFGGPRAVGVCMLLSERGFLIAFVFAVASCMFICSFDLHHNDLLLLLLVLLLLLLLLMVVLLMLMLMLMLMLLLLLLLMLCSRK